MKTLDEVLGAIKKFCDREYGEGNFFEDEARQKLNEVSVAYTTLGEDEQYDVQVYVDLKDPMHCKFITEVFGERTKKLIEEGYDYDSIYETFEDCDFSDLIRDAYDAIEQLESVQKKYRVYCTVHGYIDVVAIDEDDAIERVASGKNLLEAFDDADFDYSCKEV